MKRRVYKPGNRFSRAVPASFFAEAGRPRQVRCRMEGGGALIFQRLGRPDPISGSRDDGLPGRDGGILSGKKQSQQMADKTGGGAFRREEAIGRAFDSEAQRNGPFLVSDQRASGRGVHIDSSA